MCLFYIHRLKTIAFISSAYYIYSHFHQIRDHFMSKELLNKTLNFRKEITVILIIKVIVLIGIKIAWFSDGIDPAAEIDHHFLIAPTPTQEN